MTSSGNAIETINEKFAILRNEIEQAGKLGLLNINKHCESLVKGLLELMYGKPIKNLNDARINYPGLDLATSDNSTAYQITSDNSNAKINDTLETIVRHGFHTTFKRIQFFILSKKKSTYTIRPTSDPSFSFAWEENIIDFNDILAALQSLPVTTVNAVLQFVKDELPYAIDSIKNSGFIQIQKKSNLIDIVTDQQNCTLPFFEHWSASLTLYGQNFSAPNLYRALFNFFDTPAKKSYLNVFSDRLRKPTATSDSLTFEIPLKNTGDNSHFFHIILSIGKGVIKSEYAYYSRDEEFISNSNLQVGSLISLIIATASLYGNSPIQIDIDIDHTTNGKARYHNENTICSTIREMNSYYLSHEHSFSRMMYSAHNEELAELIQEILNGFVIGPNIVPFRAANPFLTVNHNQQIHNIQGLRNILSRKISEIDE